MGERRQGMRERGVVCPRVLVEEGAVGLEGGRLRYVAEIGF